MISCKSNDINPSDLIGKWEFTGITQNQNTDGNWTPWRVNQTLLKPIPSIYEFTSNGNFLRDGQPGGACCASGNKYSVSENKIIFEERPICPTVKCALYDWTIIEIKNDTLILEEYNTRNKYIRIK